MFHSQLLPTDISEPKLHRWTTAEYYRMAEVGLFQNKRVELVEGQVLEMSPMGHRHAIAVGLVADTLRAIINSNYHIREQMPFTINNYSEVEPDIAVVSGQRRDYLTSHPKQAALIVEVSDSTLIYDRTIKHNFYATVGIPEYWILNLIDEKLEVYRNPQLNEQNTYIYDYSSTFSKNEQIKPLLFNSSIFVADLIP